MPHSYAKGEPVMEAVRKAVGGGRGFTLIEIAVVIAIIGLLIAIALPTFLGARQRAFSAEVRQIASEWKALDFSCLVEKNFNTSKCDTNGEIGWSPPADTAVWSFSTATMQCVTAATADAALLAAGGACSPGIPGAAEWVRVSIPAVAGGELSGKTYYMVIGAGSTVRGMAGDLITP